MDGLGKAQAKINISNMELVGIVDTQEFEAGFLEAVKDSIFQTNSKLETVSAQIDPKNQREGLN